MMKLLHGNKCPICDKEWKAEGNLIPNTKDREFYGGRVKFFKEVTCDCGTKYMLFVGKKEGRDGTIEYPVIDIMLREDGGAFKSIEEAEARKMQYSVTKKDGEILETKKDKEEFTRKTVLATIVDSETKLEKLLELTIKQLRQQCKQRKIKFSAIDSKKILAEKLLAKDPNVVVAQV